MQICIIGLPQSGKTTIFNALTRGKADIATSGTTTLVPNMGISKVPEPRLKYLETIFKPAKIVQAEIKYVDIGIPAKSLNKGDGIYGPYLNYLSNADALIQVIRVFEDSKVHLVSGSIDTEHDMANMDLELIFSDLVIIDRRLERIDTSLKGAKSTERDNLIKEKTLLHKIKEPLEKDIPIWKQGLSIEETKSLSNYQFLTAKPMLIILNIGENQLDKAKSLEDQLRSARSFGQFDVVAICGKLEMELAQMSDDEAREFRESLGLRQSAINSVLSSSFNLLGLISFFTTASSELKVWTIPKGTTALKAAGKIHTDMERGFIRAEVVGFSDLERTSNLHEAKKHGCLRLEGKNYTMQDGDIVTFLFNI